MKNNLAFILIMAFCISCRPSGSPNDENLHNLQKSNTDTIVQPLDPGKLFTLSDAEKILGEKAELTENISTPREEASVFKLTYTSSSKEPKSGKTGNIYLMFEQYKHVDSAKQIYTSIKESNEDHEGFETISGVGDEAYFHSDRKNFYFIMVRKEGKILRMKVNKITANTSLNEFNRIARNVAKAM